jgi:hypothetical protein
MPKTPENLIRRRVKIDHVSVLMQHRPVIRTTNNSAAGRNDSGRESRDVTNDRRLKFPKTLFAVSFKIVSNRTADTALDFKIAVDKG